MTKSGTTTTTITVQPVPTGAGAGGSGAPDGGSDVPSDETAGNAGGHGEGHPGAPGGGSDVPSDETAGNAGGPGQGQGQGGCKPRTVTSTTVVVSTVTVTPTPAIPTFGNHKGEESSTVPADLTKTSSSVSSSVEAKPTGPPAGDMHNGTWADWSAGSTGFLTVSKYATETPSGWKP